MKMKMNMNMKMKMERYTGILLFFLFSAGMQAMTIPQGSLYFDNSKTGYSTVKMVYGRDDVSETHVLDMSFDGQKWAVSIAQTVNDIYRFTFVGGDIQAGTYDQRFSDFKDYISNTLNITRTATSDAQMSAGEIFVPVNGDNWAQGTWMNLAVWELYISDKPHQRSVPKIRADRHGIAEAAVERVVGGEIDAVVALDGYAKDGLVVLLVDFAVAGEGKRRVAD